MNTITKSNTTSAIRSNLLEQISILNNKLINLDSAEEIKKIRKLSTIKQIKQKSLVYFLLSVFF